MPQPAPAGLLHMNRCAFGQRDLADRRRDLLAEDRLQIALQRRVALEIASDLEGAGTLDEDEALAAGGARLVDRMQNDRPVDDRQQFAGQGFGGGLERALAPRDREDAGLDRGFLRPAHRLRFAHARLLILRHAARA